MFYFFFVICVVCFVIIFGCFEGGGVGVSCERGSKEEIFLGLFKKNFCFFFFWEGIVGEIVEGRVGVYN